MEMSKHQINNLRFHCKLSAAPVVSDEGTHVFHPVIAYTGDVTMPDTTLDGDIVVDLATVKISNRVPCLYDHEPTQRVGTFFTVSNDGKTLLGKIKTFPFHLSEWSKLVVEEAINEFPWNVSIGCHSIPDNCIEFIPQGKRIFVNERHLVGPFYLLRNITIQEVSFVTIGGDPNASATFLARLQKEKNMTATKFLKNKNGVMAATEQNDEVTANVDEENMTANTDPKQEDVAANTDEEMKAEGEYENDEELVLNEVDGDYIVDPVTDTTSLEYWLSNVKGMDVAGYEALDSETQLSILSEYDAWLAGQTQALTANTDEEKMQSVKASIAKKQAILSRRNSPTVNSVQASINENRRVQSIKMICGNNRKIMATAIANGWTFSQTEKYVKAVAKKEMKAKSMRPIQTGSVNGGGSLNRQLVLQTAMAMHMGLKPESCIKHMPGCNQNIVNAATSRDYRNTSIKRVLCESARSLNMNVDPLSFNARDVRETFINCRTAQNIRDANHVMRASTGFSTISATDVFHAILQAFLLDRFEMEDVMYPNISKEVKVGNFDEVTLHQYTITGRLQEMAETGKLEHLSMREVKYVTDTKPNGGYLQIPETIFIGDMLGALADLFTQLAEIPQQSADWDAQKLLIGMINGTVTAKDKDGVEHPFFDPAFGNKITGTSSALSADALDLATTAMDNFDTLNGYPMKSLGQWLLLPSSLRAKAMQLYGSTNQNYSVDKDGEVNVWAGQYEPKVWKLLNQVRSGLAGTEWLLMADKEKRPIMNKTIVAGYETPIIEQVNTEGDVWGRAYQLIYPVKFTAMYTEGAVLMTGQA